MPGRQKREQAGSDSQNDSDHFAAERMYLKDEENSIQKYLFDLPWNLNQGVSYYTRRTG